MLARIALCIFTVSARYVDSMGDEYAVKIEDEYLVKLFDRRARWSLRPMTNDTVREKLHEYKEEIRTIQMVTNNVVVKVKDAEEAGKKSGLFKTDVKMPGVNGLVMEVIDNYGCNCRGRKGFREAKLAAHMDDLDATCKHYSASLKCLSVLYPECDIENVDVTGCLAVTIKFGTIQVLCLPDKENPCAYEVCQVELQAMADQIKAQSCSEGLNIEYLLDEPHSFDAEANCIATGVMPTGDTPVTTPDGGTGGVTTPYPLGTAPDACCGKVPYLMPYASSITSCCTSSDSKALLYHPTEKKCCAEGHLVGIKDSCTAGGRTAWITYRG